MRGTTFYSAKSGLEVMETTSSKTRKGFLTKEGRIRLRAFPLEKGGSSIRLVLTPAEAHKLSRAILFTLKTKPEKPLQVIIHKSNKNGRESTAIVSLDHFRTKKGEGVGVVIARDGEKVNIPLSREDALYLTDLLQHLSLQQSFWEVEKVEEEEEEQEIVETVDEAFGDEDEDVENLNF